MVVKHSHLNTFIDELVSDDKTITIDMFERFKSFFSEFWTLSEDLMNVEADSFVNEIMTWGIINNEPMAIYMG